MKLVKVIFIIAIAMVLVMACTGATMLYDDEEEDEAPSLGVDPVSTNLPNTPSALRGVSRFLAQEDKPKKLKCRKNPAVCLAQGSPGPNCCKNKCVDLRTDHRNCGVCGKKCKFTEECCRGGCVNLAFDKRHCGRCNNPCKKGRKGSFCVYGMCNYA